jgi:hypothetical protein
MNKLLVFAVVLICGVSYFKNKVSPGPAGHENPTAFSVSAAAGSAPGIGGGLGHIPPELIPFMNSSLLTTTPAGTQDLSPASRLALQQIAAQARSNPAAFQQQLAAAAKAFSGSK